MQTQRTRVQYQLVMNEGMQLVELSASLTSLVLAVHSHDLVLPTSEVSLQLFPLSVISARGPNKQAARDHVLE